MASFSIIKTTWQAFAVLFCMGIGNGYLAISLITFLQQKTPREMLGRVMSLVYLANLGLAPISQALAGVIIKLNFEAVFWGSGFLLIILAIWMYFTPAARSLGAQMVGLE